MNPEYLAGPDTSLPEADQDLDRFVDMQSAETERRIAQMEAQYKNRTGAPDAPSTKLIVEKAVGRATNTEFDTEFATKHFTVARSNTDRPFTYFQVKDLSNTDKVEVLMRSDSGLEPINLPEAMLGKLAEYLRLESRDLLGGFDCASFMHFMAEVPYEYGHFDAEKWNISQLMDESNLKTGDMIMITDDAYANTGNRASIKHFAIYLNSGLYVSKFGTGGKLIVANLEEMKKGFEGEVAFQLTERV